MREKEEYGIIEVKGTGKSRESKIVLGVVDTDNYEHLYFVPIQPNGEYQEMAIGINLSKLKSYINQIADLDTEIVFRGIAKVNDIKEKITMKPSDNNIELTFTKPGTHELDAEILSKIRPEKRNLENKLPYHDIRMVVKKEDLVNAIKIFVKKHYKERGL